MTKIDKNDKKLTKIEKNDKKMQNLNEILI